MSSPLTGWTITFEDVSDPSVFQTHLEQSLPFKRGGTSACVQTRGSDVVFSFESAATRHKLLQKCSQTFARYGVYKKHTLTLTSATASAASASTSVADTVMAAPVASDTLADTVMAAPVASDTLADTVMAAPVASDTLAVRDPVAEINALAEGLSRSQLHALAVRFSLLYAGEAVPQALGAVERILSAKRAAAAVFSGPLDSWEAELAPLALKAQGFEGVTCECRCGCKNFTGEARHCRGERCRIHVAQAAYNRTQVGQTKQGWCLCAQCLSVSECHVCLGNAKAPVAIAPPTAPSGVYWYFNWPDLDWLSVNRPVEMDPFLHDIEEVIKTEKLENSGRFVRPHGWQKSFLVLASLADTTRAVRRVGIRLDNFVMNATWARHDVVKYLKTWVVDNLAYTGRVLNVPPLPVLRDRSPSPPSPYVRMESTIQFEELGDGELTDDRTEIAAAEAAMPVDDENWTAEFEELTEALKRRRLL